MATIEEKAQDARALLKLKLKLISEDSEIQDLQASAAESRALNARRARHAAAVEDFGTGDMLTRAVNSFKVRRAVRDLAKAEGREISGAPVKVPAGDVEAPAHNA